MKQYQNLFSPIKVKSLTLKNRVVMTPMGTNFAMQNGEISDTHIQYYEQRAKGGTGLLIVENASVNSPEGANGTTQLRLDHDSYIPSLYRLCETIHKYGTKIAIQLNHAGASATSSRTGMQPVSASNISSKENGEDPRPLTKEEIMRIVKKYGEAARRAQIAGFDAIEVHAGHSYLVSQFLSPTTNNRTDEFGGSAKNRARIATLIMQEIRQQVGPHFTLLVRVSLDEFVANGNTIEDSLELLTYFQEEADIIDVSAALNGSIQYQIDAPYLPDGWRSFMAKRVKERFNKPTITTGNIRNPQVAEEILVNGDADFIGMGRGLLAEPNWVKKVQSGQEETLRKCISCNIGCAGHRIGLNRPIRCTVNPNVVNEDMIKDVKVKKPCNVVIIGGGTAGLEAACTAAEVGCTTFLIEKRAELGGLAADISKIPDKKRIADFPNYLIQRANQLHNLFILKNTEATIPLVESLRPDIIVNATGSSPLLPPITGLHESLMHPNVGTIQDMIQSVNDYPKTMENEKVVVIGGGAVGLDVVEFFAPRGCDVTIIEMANQLGKDLDPVSKSSIKEIMNKHAVTALTNTKLTSVSNTQFTVQQGEDTTSIPFDYGFICLGMRSHTPMLEALTEHFSTRDIPVCNIGDSALARQIIHGVQEARNILTVLKNKDFL